MPRSGRSYTSLLSGNRLPSAEYMYSSALLLPDGSPLQPLPASLRERRHGLRDTACHGSLLSHTPDLCTASRPPEHCQRDDSGCCNGLILIPSLPDCPGGQCRIRFRKSGIPAGARSLLRTAPSGGIPSPFPHTGAGSRTPFLLLPRFSIQDIPGTGPRSPPPALYKSVPVSEKNGSSFSGPADCSRSPLQGIHSPAPSPFRPRLFSPLRRKPECRPPVPG